MNLAQRSLCGDQGASWRPNSWGTGAPCWRAQVRGTRPRFGRFVENPRVCGDLLRTISVDQALFYRWGN